jgi:hypothetical protein
MGIGLSKPAFLSVAFIPSESNSKYFNFSSFFSGVYINNKDHADIAKSFEIVITPQVRTFTPEPESPAAPYGPQFPVPGVLKIRLT